MAEFSLVAVFLVGLLGGVHCLGMCGSIVGIFTNQLSPSPQPSPIKGEGAETRSIKLFSLPQREITSDLAVGGGQPSRMASSFIRVRERGLFNLAYSSGRIASYAVAGALVGAVGQAGLFMRDAVPVQHLLFALSSLMLIALGLYLAGVWGAVRQLERMGGSLWKVLQPFTARLLPVNTVPRALGLGVLWGWLPCGLVYSVLLTALASGSAAQGALIMLAFGLGTLPNLLAIGLFWEGVKGWVQSPRVRLAAGLLVMLFGLYGLFKVGYSFYVYGWSGSCHVPA